MIEQQVKLKREFFLKFLSTYYLLHDINDLPFGTATYHSNKNTNFKIINDAMYIIKKNICVLLSDNDSNIRLLNDLKISTRLLLENNITNNEPIEDLLSITNMNRMNVLGFGNIIKKESPINSKDMSLKDLKKLINHLNLQNKCKNFIEKQEFVNLLQIYQINRCGNIILKSQEEDTIKEESNENKYEHYIEFRKDVCKDFLYLASSLNNISAVKTLLSYPEIDVNIKYQLGTPLELACANGYYDIVKLLLENDTIDVNKYDDCWIESGKSPLYTASWHGHTNIVELLLKQPNINSNQSNIWGTPLWIAAREGHYEITKLLLDSRIEYCNDYTDIKKSPLFNAIRRRHINVAKLLIKHPNYKTNQDIYDEIVRYDGMASNIMKLVLD